MTTYEMRHLDTDGHLYIDELTIDNLAERLDEIKGFFGREQVTRLTIDAAFGTIEIIPQGGLSLLTE